MMRTGCPSWAADGLPRLEMERAWTRIFAEQVGTKSKEFYEQLSHRRGLHYRATCARRVLPESHPQFVGMYSGELSSPEVLKAVEGADLVIDAGGVCFHDLNTAAYTSRILDSRLLTIGVDYVRSGDRVYNPVRMADVFDGVAKAVQRKFTFKAPQRPTRAKPRGNAGDPITADGMYERYRDFLRPNDQIVIETGSSTMGIVSLPLPDGAQVHGQSLWGSIGWATGAALGIALADRSRRTVLFTGEGSHQLTAADVGTMGRNGLKPVIFVLNNQGYMIERALEKDPNWEYNDLAAWDYHALPRWAAKIGSRPRWPLSESSIAHWQKPAAADPRATSKSSVNGSTCQRAWRWPTSTWMRCTASGGLFIAPHKPEA